MPTTGRDARPPVVWPDGKDFAFTVFDDTDNQTVENGKPVYDLLEDLGFRTTKSVWPLPSTAVDRFAGETCADPEYVAWTRRLQSRGFEIAYHGARSHTSPRSVTEQALARFAKVYGHAPRAYANHSRNYEGVYWGDARLSGWRRRIYNLLTRSRSAGVFRGHDASSDLFWGDLCRSTIDYVRDFVFDDIDTLRACPWMPYTDPERPFVRWWFASAEGADVAAFVDTISEPNQDRLERGRGACIMYTHFASGFVENGEVVPRFRELMERLASKNGWYVPVSTLLDRIVAQRGEQVLDPANRAALERRWLASTIRVRGRSFSRRLGVGDAR